MPKPTTAAFLESATFMEGRMFDLRELLAGMDVAPGVSVWATLRQRLIHFAQGFYENGPQGEDENTLLNEVSTMLAFHGMLALEAKAAARKAAETN